MDTEKSGMKKRRLSKIGSWGLIIAGLLLLSLVIVPYAQKTLDDWELKKKIALEPTVPQPAEPEKKEPVILPKYLELQKINNEIVGWIKIEDTKIDHPVFQHADNEYYLDKNIELKKSKHGVIYLDYRNKPDLSDRNTMVFGHNLYDGLMFGNLVKYKNRQFFDQHRKIYMDNLYDEYEWEVFSVYVLNADKETLTPMYASDEEYLAALNKFKNRSIFKINTVLTAEDRIITLITCSYETKNSRTIIHAKCVGKRS